MWDRIKTALQKAGEILGITAPVNAADLYPSQEPSPIEPAREERAQLASSALIHSRVASQEEKTAEPDRTWKVDLPSALLENTLYDYLGFREKAFLAKSSEQFFQLTKYKNAALEFDRLVPLAAQLLLHVVRGEEKATEALLKAEPYLPLIQGRVEDYSKRTFSKISALQYTAWANNVPGLKFLLNYMPLSQMHVALDQLEELEREGTEHGKHYDFSELIKPLQAYVDYLKNWHSVDFNDFNHKEAERLWLRVGLAQRKVPVYVATFYCNPRLSLSQLVEIGELPLYLPVYDLNFSHCLGHIHSWFPLQEDKNGLGFTYAIYRGPHTTAQGARGDGAGGRTARIDLAALKLIAQENIKEYDRVVTSLKKVIKQSNDRKKEPEKSLKSAPRKSLSPGV